MDLLVIERRVRPTGQPPRCAVCGAPCSFVGFGDPLCREHAAERAGRKGIAALAAERGTTRQARREAAGRNETA